MSDVVVCGGGGVWFRPGAGMAGVRVSGDAVRGSGSVRSAAGRGAAGVSA